MDKQLICFLVVGRMGKSLIYSKAEPFVINPDISLIYIFRETEGFALPKVSYITLPEWILRLRPGFLYRLIRLLAEPVQLIWHSARKRPDIINGYHLIPKGINSLIAARLTGSKCIISIIGGISEIDTYSRFKWFLKPMNLWALKKSDLITTKGGVVNRYLNKHDIPLSKVLVYNGAINLEKFYFNPSIPKDIDILFVGTFRNLKGPDRVLHILAALKKDFAGIKACFIGQGFLFNSCVDIAKSLGISENVLFTGQIDNPATYFQRSKILVMPSRSEGLPTSMLEAMACGCVPVVSDVGNIRDAAIHSENAFVIDDYMNIESFTNYIYRLLNDEKLRAGMALKSISTVRDKYTPERQSEIVSMMIEKLF